MIKPTWAPLALGGQGSLGGEIRPECRGLMPCLGTWRSGLCRVGEHFCPVRRTRLLPAPAAPAPVLPSQIPKCLARPRPPSDPSPPSTTINGGLLNTAPHHGDQQAVRKGGESKRRTGLRLAGSAWPGMAPLQQGNRPGLVALPRAGHRCEQGYSRLLARRPMPPPAVPSHPPPPALSPLL